MLNLFLTISGLLMVDKSETETQRVLGATVCGVGLSRAIRQAFPE